jgi:DNA-binding LacI/PurR family transcriptional regulator
LVLVGSHPGCNVSDSAGPDRRPTIRDVAERAGVSKSLVSLVMRGEPMVSDDKRRRVQQAAAELGYRTNFAARSLSAVRSMTVGVLVADLRNPMLIDVVERAADVLEGAGLSTLITSAVRPAKGSNEARIDSRAIGVIKDLGVEGMLVVGSVPDRPAMAKIVGDIPVVVAAATAEGLHADVVRNDDRLGMRLVIDYLVARGHRRIAHLGGRGGGVADERASGYRAAMQYHGLDDAIVIVESGFTEDSGYRGTASLLRRHESVTAVAAVNDLAAAGALSAAMDSGMKVPDDLAVTGYDDTYVAAIRQVSLTSINPDSQGIGALAARCLVRRIEAPDSAVVEHLLPPKLVTRASASAPVAARGTTPAEEATSQSSTG